MIYWYQIAFINLWRNCEAFGFFVPLPFYRILKGFPLIEIVTGSSY
jgi:hypothetical protein